MEFSCALLRELQLSRIEAESSHCSWRTLLSFLWSVVKW